MRKWKCCHITCVQCAQMNVNTAVFFLLRRIHAYMKMIHRESKTKQACRNKMPAKLGHISGFWDWPCVQYKYWFCVSGGLSSVPSVFLAFHHSTRAADYTNSSFRITHLGFRTHDGIMSFSFYWWRLSMPKWMNCMCALLVVIDTQADTTLLRLM